MTERSASLSAPARCLLMTIWRFGPTRVRGFAGPSSEYIARAAGTQNKKVVGFSGMMLIMFLCSAPSSEDPRRLRGRYQVMKSFAAKEPVAMTASPEMAPTPREERKAPVKSSDPLRLVNVASEPVLSAGGARTGSTAPAISFRLEAFGKEPRSVRYDRLAANTVGASVAWLRRRAGTTGVYTLKAGAVGTAPKGLSSLPQSASGVGRMLKSDAIAEPDSEAISAAISVLRDADAVIAGPLSADDANSPGLLPHLADLARLAYRALHAPRELVANPGFAQVARRFQFIQMDHQIARLLGSGAVDLGILGQRLRQVRGDDGEFAITSFGSHGLLWSEGRWLEIDPIGDDNVNQVRAGAQFCTAWVVARRFLDASAPQALAYARSAAARAVSGSARN
jgi:hypothetical protein